MGMGEERRITIVRIFFAFVIFLLFRQTNQRRTSGPIVNLLFLFIKM